MGFLVSNGCNSVPMLGHVLADKSADLGDDVLNVTGRIDPTAWEDFDEPMSEWRIVCLDDCLRETLKRNPAFGLVVDGTGRYARDMVEWEAVS
jgi:hypothetical protein